MPEYHIKIKHGRNETVKEDVIEHRDIKYFLKVLIKAGWQIICCTELDDVVEVKPADVPLDIIKAAQPIH